jgi:aminopeptidase YwaD
LSEVLAGDPYPCSVVIRNVNDAEYRDRAWSYLTTLCSVKPNRRTGSPGNREATEFFASIVGELGYDVDARPFPCLDYVGRHVSLEAGGESFEVFISPYSLGCDVTAELVAVSSVEELEECKAQGKILLMLGDICAEQLMPKNFVFYNPDHHQRIYALLEEKHPAGIITATARKPEMVGALYPFPLIVDGDFAIPNVHCTDQVGAEIAKKVGETFRLVIDAERIPVTANNVIARVNPEAERKIVVTAHIDAYEDTPGASDNASGTVVLLLLAEMLADYPGDLGIEIAAFNGEDHYSAAGQMDYLERYASEFGRIVVAINIDDVGYKEGGTAYSTYVCPPEVEEKAEAAFGEAVGIIRGEPWFSGDHMIFVQNGIPAVAFTAELMPELMATVTHTSLDTLDLIDPTKVVDLARALHKFVMQF